MAEPAKKKPRITEDLRTLGRIIHRPNTPKQRTPSNRHLDASGGAEKVLTRTPGSATERTPTGQHASASAKARRPGSVRRGAPTTPHAIRAAAQRRNAILASGGNRRRLSGHPQRKTPRDDLRALSKVLAKRTGPRAPSPAEATPRRKRSFVEEMDDSPVVGAAPRLSMKLDDLEDDSFHERPPRVSYPFEEEEELETRRREALAKSRLSMTDILDPSMIDLENLGAGALEEITERRRQILEGDMIDIGAFEEGDADGETGDLRDLLNRRQSGQTGEITEITDGEPTFVFNIPERSRLSLAPPTIPRTPPEQVDDGLDDGMVVDDAVAGADIDLGVDDEYEDLEDRVEVPRREDSLAPAEAQPQAQSTAKVKPKRLPKEVKISQWGTEYPSFPPAVVKRLAGTFSKSFGGSGKINKEALGAMQQASDWFFEQVAEDLVCYADHAGRKTIEEADMVTLMKRQRLLNSNTTLFSLASKYLPRELLQDVRLPVAKSRKRKRAGRMATIDEDEEEE